PMLDYHGRVGLQYNPIAIAQYGLANFNLFHGGREEQRRRKFLAAADWLASNLEQNRAGLWVWQHHFDWDYRTPLRAPWFSALAQGQGISLLTRAHLATGEARYLEAAQRAFGPFLFTVDHGGVTIEDDKDGLWFEEYVVQPPTHILNGFIWASWGVLDFFLATGERRAQELFQRAVRTLAANLDRYDCGYWSLYEQSGTRLPMLASPFYHRLHIVQLRVLYQLTGEESFARFAARWEELGRRRWNRVHALAGKALFKLVYY
ncbi:MAG: D-glucuronyl C5-epimerase family protein, partial [Terriglobales bacterium]